MNINILEEAKQDLVDGFYFYESQSSGLGNYFHDSLFSDIDSLMVSAGAHPTYKGYYKLLSKRFPFAVYYKINKEKVNVYAVLDCRKNPAWIRDRLK